MQRLFLLLYLSSSYSHLLLHAKLGVENSLAETNGLGCDLDKLVVVDKLNSFLKRHNNGRCQEKLFVSARRANSRKLLSLAGVDVVWKLNGAEYDFETPVTGAIALVGEKKPKAITINTII